MVNRCVPAAGPGVWQAYANALTGIYRREILHFARERSQFLSAAMRPVVWLLIMGYGLRPAFRGAPGMDYTHFIFPGVIAMTLLFAAMQTAITIVWDREFGFLKEILAAPIPRSAVVLGKCLSGCTIATAQGALTIFFAPLIGLSLGPEELLALLGAMVAVAFTVTAFGLCIAARMTSLESFGTITNFVIMPLFFLSGSIFPLEGLPPWLLLPSLANPLTYGVDAMRAGALGAHAFPIRLDLVVLAAMGACLVTLATQLFGRE